MDGSGMSTGGIYNIQLVDQMSKSMYNQSQSAKEKFIKEERK